MKRLKAHVAEPAAFSRSFNDRIGRAYRIAADLSEAEVLFVRVETRVDRDLLRNAPKLRVVVSPTTGQDHLDLPACRAAGVEVITLKGRTGFLRNLPNTAEHAFALLLALQRQVPRAFRSVQGGGWNQAEFRGRTIRGQHLGIVGFGRLGRIAARLALGFGMTVSAYDPYVRRLPQTVQRMHTLLALAKQSDVVSVHASLTPETVRLLGPRFFKAMKPSAVLINTARGKIVDERALLAALREGRLAGAGLDVLAAEPGKPGKDDPLVRYSRSHPNLIITPHIGGQTEEAVEAADAHCLELLAKKYPQHD